MYSYTVKLKTEFVNLALFFIFSLGRLNFCVKQKPSLM